jgi:hypothetical protein
MISEDRKRLVNVVGVVNYSLLDGKEFAVDVLELERPMAVGNIITLISDESFQYRGEDSLDRSIFTPVGQPFVPFGPGLRQIS